MVTPSTTPSTYGPYVKRGKVNASLPKDLSPDDVTIEQAIALLDARAAAGPAKTRGRGTRATKSTKAAGSAGKSAKKSTAKKSTAKSRTKTPTKSAAAAKKTKATKSPSKATKVKTAQP